MNFKHFLCLLLALAMTLSLAGCAREDHKETEDPDDSGEALVGDWYFEIEITEQITGVSDITLEEIPVCFSFREDGTLLLAVDEDIQENTAQEFERQLLEILDEWVYGERERAGYTREEIDELFAEAKGMSVDKFMRDTLEDVNIRGKLDALAAEYYYHADDKLLTIDGIPMLYTIDGNTLTITDCVDPNFWASVGLEIPVVMTRKD